MPKQYNKISEALPAAVQCHHNQVTMFINRRLYALVTKHVNSNVWIPGTSTIAFTEMCTKNFKIGAKSPHTAKFTKCLSSYVKEWLKIMLKWIEVMQFVQVLFWQEQILV